MATMMQTVIGSEKFLNAEGKSLFSDMTLPEGINRETLINRILLRSGEFEILYSDLDFFTEAIKNWADSYARTFERWIKALSIDYAPLENYDRIEEWHNDNNFRNNTHNHGYVSVALQNNVSAYDSSDFQPHDQSTSRDDTDMYNNNDGDGIENKNGRAHGNIGVTTSQQMLESELKIAEWNLYDHIADLFIKEFCICVY